MRTKRTSILTERQAFYQDGDNELFSLTHLESSDDLPEVESNIVQTKQTSNYFQNYDKEDASFGHNAMIRRLVIIRKMDGDFFKIIDENLEFTNMHLMQQFASDQALSIIMNIRFIDDNLSNLRSIHFSNSVGIWLGRKSAIMPDGTTCVFSDCLLPSEFGDMRLFVIALMLADQLFITVSKVAYLNQIISLLKIIEPYYSFSKKKIWLTDISPIQVEQIHLEELDNYFSTIQIISHFPQSPQELEWTFFNYQHENVYKISGKSWRFIQIPVKLLKNLVIQLSINIRKETPMNSIDDMFQKQLIYRYLQVVQLYINEMRNECVSQYTDKINSKAQSTLPLKYGELNSMLQAYRDTYVEQFSYSLLDFRNFNIYQTGLSLLKQIIQTKEEELLIANDDVGELLLKLHLNEEQQQVKFKSYIISWNYLLIMSAVCFVICSKVCKLRFLKFLLSISNFGRIKNILILNFFQHTYTAYVKDFVTKLQSILENESNEELYRLHLFEITLDKRCSLMVSKTHQLKEHCDTLKNEIENTKSLIEQTMDTDHDYKFKEIRAIQEELCLREDIIFQLKMELSKVKKNNFRLDLF